MTAAEIAAALARRQLRACTPLTDGRGRNSRVFRIESDDGELFALKAYPPRGQDPRDRLATEQNALHFMASRGITCVPLSIATDRGEGFALLSWIAGRHVESPTEQDIRSATAFLGDLHANRSAATSSIGLAAEACLSGEEVLRQVRRRFSRLKEVAAYAEELGHALEAKFLPAIDEVESLARSGYAKAGLDFATLLAPEQRTLSPSDFGFHNALRREDGSLAYIDFEYFGWDDPAKLTCDTMIHPGMALGADLARSFLRRTLALYRETPSLAIRVGMLLPLYRLRWCAILLNEFLPERWAVRAHASPHDRAEAQARQLAKAVAYFETGSMLDNTLCNDIRN